MDINKVNELAKVMKDNGLSKLRIEESDFKISLEREQTQIVPAPSLKPASPTGTADPQTTGDTKDAPKEETGIITIKSPVVGVFYASPSPSDKAYAAVGDRIEKGDVLCIVEAMKLMNEINAECSGVIEEVCVGNGQVVEFDQPLYRMRCEDE